jgi:hypothetical protein
MVTGQTYERWVATQAWAASLCLGIRKFPEYHEPLKRRVISGNGYGSREAVLLTLSALAFASTCIPAYLYILSLVDIWSLGT